LFGDDVNPGSDPPWLALGAMLRSGREKLGLTAPPAVLEALNEREDGGSEE
jgi:hypothetical protein